MSHEPLFEAPKIEELSELLPAYDIEAFVAQGGMGAVYKARQKSLERDVAIKILPREFGADEGFRKSFEAEAKAMAKLNDPNLIGVYDFGEVDGMPYIVMEFVNGKSLHHSAYGKAIDQNEAARLAQGICRGLAHAHEAGILHRDIKPANILLDQRKRPKIGDFGLARPIDAGRSGEAVFGTPGYTAPEVLNDRAAIDKRSDIFSLGVILYELLTGELPEKAYVPVSKKGEIDPRFDKIIRRATHPSAALRYPDAGAMEKELSRLLDAFDKPTAATIVTQAPAAPKALAVDDDQVAATGAATASSTPESSPPVVHVSGGHHWHFLRNLVIIVMLIGAIYGMWKALEWKKAYNARQAQEQREEEQKAERLRELEAKQALVDAANNPTPTPTPTPSPDPDPSPTPTPDPTPPDPVPETPLEVLARLKRTLANGDRTEFPPNTLDRGATRYFLVETPMNWARANAFAEAHGGQLVSCPTEATSRWISGKLPDETSIWLGGGAVGRNNWGWTDGTEWSLRTPSTSTGTAASISDLGSIRAKSPGELMPFFIQWNMDGSNPAALETQLERTETTLESNNPAWPPGSLSFESRRYLIVGRSVSWDEAAELARLGGGHLAVPSDEAESAYLRRAAKNALAANSACWIGGQHNGRAWAWATGEPWTFADWADGSPNGDAASDSALRIVVGESGGWDDADPAGPETNGALIIEWSSDPTIERAAANPAARELVELRKKATTAILKIKKGYDKTIFENGKSLKWDLDFWLRGNPKDAIAKYTPRVNALKGQIQDGGFIPADIERAALPFKAIQIVNGAIGKQTALEEKYHQDLDKLRVSYVKRLQDAKIDLEQRGLSNQARALDNEIGASGANGREFLEFFNP